VTLGRRCYEALLLTGAHPFGELAKDWDALPDAVRERYEAAGRIVDAATRADVVGQLGTMALNTRAAHEYQTLRQAADRVEAGR